MLILFDIDGTLLLTRGAGRRAMEAAGRAVLGPSFTLDGRDIAGCLDPVILAGAAEAAGLMFAEEAHARIRADYARRLLAHFDTVSPPELLPGVAELVAVLRSRDDLTLGVLTGNYPETGRMKIERAGLDPGGFVVSAWGCDGPDRRSLVGVALERDAAIRGARLAGERVVVIGDTRHDVDCARHGGCRSIGVATGGATAAELAAAGADLVLDDLADTGAVTAWIERAFTATIGG